MMMICCWKMRLWNSIDDDDDDVALLIDESTVLQSLISTSWSSCSPPPPPLHPSHSPAAAFVALSATPTSPKIHPTSTQSHHSSRYLPSVNSYDTLDYVVSVTNTTEQMD